LLLGKPGRQDQSRCSTINHDIFTCHIVSGHAEGCKIPRIDAKWRPVWTSASHAAIALTTRQAWFIARQSNRLYWILLHQKEGM
jgi:hypothetical protein